MSSAWRSRPLTDVNDLLLDRYQLRRCIGRGSRADVYEAFDSLLGDLVALKILAPEALDPEGARQRLLEEVRLARKVTHANVCRVLEFGIAPGRDADAAPVPFITMELLRGETLAERLERVGRLEPAAARDILLRVLDGLGAIHRAGIAHGHVNAEHVFLARNDKNLTRTVLLSFGLAQPLGEGPAAAPPLEADIQAAGALLRRMLRPQGEPAPRPLESLFRVPSGLVPAPGAPWETSVLGELEPAAGTRWT